MSSIATDPPTDLRPALTPAAAASPASPLRADLIAGLTTAVMLIPQGMAYAMLAGLPPVHGLYASTLPLALYALLGRSPSLSVGPVAMDSMIVAAGVSALAISGSANYILLSALLAAMMGGFQVLLGLLRAGGAVNFLSAPVLSGFTSAAALIIATSQLGPLLGVKLSGAGGGFPSMIQALPGALTHTHWATAALGAVAVGALIALKRWLPRWPAALVVVGFSSVAVWAIGLSAFGIRVVGDIPAGLPSLSLPMFDWGSLRALLPTAATLALVGFAEAYSVAKTLHPKGQPDIDPNRELIALGAANLGASIVRGYPVTGGLSRSAVNARAGAQSRWAGVVTFAAVILALLFLTPAFRFVPLAALAAIILTAVASLIDWSMIKRLRVVKRSDLVLLLLTSALTLGVGMAEGLLGGVAASVLWLAIRQSRPHIAVLGRLPSTQTFRNVLRHPTAQRFDGLLIIRPDAPLYFGNCQHLRESITQLSAAMSHPLRAVIIDASAISDLDASGEQMLRVLIEDLARADARLYLAAVRGPVLDVIRRAHLDDALSTPLLHEVNAAVEHALTTTTPTPSTPAAATPSAAPSALR
jgi:sulfate permease, SulP family